MELEVDRFLENIKLSRSEGTYREYLKDVGLFLEFCDTREPTVALAKEYLQGLMRQGKSSATVARRASALRMLASESGHVLRVATPVTDKKLPSWLEPEEIVMYLEAAADYSATTPGKEHVYPIVVTLIGCGLRVGELLALRLKDLFEDGRIHVIRQKRHKEDMVPMDKSDFKVLWQWAMVIPKGKGNNPLLFPNISYGGLYRDIKQVAVLAGITKRVTPHVLRHTCGTRLAYAGMPVERIAQMLGDTIEVARVYIHISATDIQKMIPSLTGSSGGANG